MSSPKPGKAILSAVVDMLLQGIATSFEARLHDALVFVALLRINRAARRIIAGLPGCLIFARLAILVDPGYRLAFGWLDEHWPRFRTHRRPGRRRDDLDCRFPLLDRSGDYGRTDNGSIDVHGGIDDYISGARRIPCVIHIVGIIICHRTEPEGALVRRQQGNDGADRRQGDNKVQALSTKPDTPLEIIPAAAIRDIKIPGRKNI